MEEVSLIPTGDSACLASILRTYHIWQQFNTYDASWQLGRLAPWTWAELSIGIVVGCLPSLPKFFGHIGPKIYRRVSGTGSGREINAAHVPKSKALNKVKRPFGKYGFGSIVSDPSDNPNIPRAQLHDRYLVLDEFDASPPRDPFGSATAGQPGGAVTARDRIEYGE